MFGKSENKKRIVFLRSLAVDPDPRVMREALWLNKAGYETLILGWDREGNSSKTTSFENIIIKRFYFPGSFGGGIKNIFGLVYFDLVAFLYLLIYSPRYVHACDLDTAFPAFLLKKLKGSIFVYDIFDDYAESRNVGPFFSIVKKIEQWVVKNSDLTVIADEKRLEQMLVLGVEDKEKIVVIYNTPENNIDDESDEYKQFLPEKYVAYVGSLYKDRGITTLIEAVEEIDDLSLVIAGFGPEQNNVESLSEISQKVVFLGKISHSIALAIEKSALAIIALYDPAIPNNRYASPNKLFEACLLGRPLVTSKGTTLSSFVDEHEIGYTVTFGDKQELIEVLTKLQNGQLSAEKGQRAHELYETGLSAEKMEVRLVNAYLELNNLC